MANRSPSVPTGSSPPLPTALAGRSDRELLRLAIEAHLHQPAIALWRATEFAMLREVEFGAPVLDLGCGGGAVAGVVLHDHWPRDGLELLASEARAARALGVYRGVIRSDATRAPLAAGIYATVFSQSVLEHIPDDRAAVREAARALAPGGRLVFTVPSPAFAERIRHGPGGEAALQATNDRLGHFHYRSLDDWAALLNACGLGIVGTGGHLPARTQHAWQRLDALMTHRLGRRRILDIFRALHRRRLVPRSAWIAAWTAMLWRPFRRPVDDPGGFLIVAQAPDGAAAP